MGVLPRGGVAQWRGLAESAGGGESGEGEQG